MINQIVNSQWLLCDVNLTEIEGEQLFSVPVKFVSITITENI